MNTRGLAATLAKTLSPAVLGLFIAAGGATVSSAPGLAQQAGRMPVTPFGPRVKPPAGAPRRQRPAQPRGPKPEIVMKNGMWKVVCETVPVAKDKTAKTCYVSATAIDTKRKNVFLSLIVLKNKVKDKKGNVKITHMMNVRAPVGVYLPTGIGLEIDGKAIARVPFIRCNPVFCESLAEARPQTLNKLKKGSKARFIFYAAPGVGLPLEFKLSGFTAAMKKLDSLPN